MGRLVARLWPSGPDRPASLGRVVMLTPPNQGAERATNRAALPPSAGSPGLRALTLAPAPPPAAVRLPPGRDRGHPAGQPAGLDAIPGADHGKVSVAATRVQGMAGHLALPVTHTFLMPNPQVIAQTLAFARGGRFDPALDPPRVPWP
jgi:hypothetical protein